MSMVTVRLRCLTAAAPGWRCGICDTWNHNTDLVCRCGGGRA